MEALLTIIIFGAAIFFWCIKPNTVKTNNKTDILEYFSNMGYTLQNISYYYEIGGIIKQQEEKQQRDYFFVEISGKNGVCNNYKLYKNDIYNLLVGSLQDNNEYCYFFKKGDTLVCAASYGKALIEVFFNKNPENLNKIEFEELKKYIGFIPRKHQF